MSSGRCIREWIPQLDIQIRIQEFIKNFETDFVKVSSEIQII